MTRRAVFLDRDGVINRARVVEGRRPPRPEVADYIWDWDAQMPGGFYVMGTDAAGWPPWEEFNRDGLRDRTRSREKAAGLRRIAILGDSVTLGAEIRPEEAYPQLLGAMLARDGITDVRIVNGSTAWNAGMSSWHCCR